MNYYRTYVDADWGVRQSPNANTRFSKVSIGQKAWIGVLLATSSSSKLRTKNLEQFSQLPIRGFHGAYIYRSRRIEEASLKLLPEVVGNGEE